LLVAWLLLKQTLCGYIQESRRRGKKKVFPVAFFTIIMFGGMFECGFCSDCKALLEKEVALWPKKP